MSIVKLKNPLTDNYQELKKNILDSEFAWYWHKQLLNKDRRWFNNSDNTQNDNYGIYSHSFLYRPTRDCLYPKETDPNCRLFHAVVVEIMQYNNIEIDMIYRMCANCVHPTEKNIPGPEHVDHLFPHKNLIVYLTNFKGGATCCGGETYNGKEDDIITFEGTHNFYPPVDNRRVVLVATYTELDNGIKK